jgi:DNA-binding NtrC family response regulator
VSGKLPHPDAIGLLIVGTPRGEIAHAAALARAAGAEVATADDPAAALALIRQVPVALVMIEVAFDVAAFLAALAPRQAALPVLACGIDAPAELAVAAIRAGARDYVPLPSDPALIAAVLAQAAAGDETVSVDALVGRTVDEVERALILRTLARCRGNRTSASTILGISVRTMRNKLKSFVEAGIAVMPAADAHAR